jgi:hypothetical protein
VLANEAGLFKTNILALLRWLVAEFSTQKEGVDNNYKAPADAAISSLMQFIDSNRDKMLVVESFAASNTMSKYGNILMPPNQQPRGEILILKSLNDKQIRINVVAWKTWVVRVLGHSPTTLMIELGKQGVRTSKQNLSAGLQTATNTRVRCFELDLTMPSLATLMDD